MLRQCERNHGIKFKRLHGINRCLFQETGINGFFYIYRFINAIGEHKLKDALFKRYNDPVALLKSYSLAELMDFFIFLVGEEQEDRLWEVWLHKPIEDSFKDFKRKRMKPIYKRKIKTISENEENALIERAKKFVDPR